MINATLIIGAVIAVPLIWWFMDDKDKRDRK